LEVCKSLHIQSACAFSIKNNANIIGVLEFYTYERKKEDNNLLLIINILSNQISRFLEYQYIQQENKNLINKFKFAVKAGNIGVWEWDFNTNALRWDDQMFVLYGKKKESFKNIYQDWAETLHPDNFNEVTTALREAVKTCKPFDMEFRIITPDGDIRYIAAKSIIIYSDEGKPKSFLGLNWDVTKEKKIMIELNELNHALAHDAYYDSLTGLMNRHAFEDAAKRMLAQAKHHHSLLGVLFIDLDYFKKVNDSLGHHAGDKVLVETAKRLMQTLRGEDLISRLGGDEFAVMLNDIQNISDAENIANKIIARINQAFYIDDQEVYIGASIGIALYPEMGESVLELLQKSDEALLRAKHEGRGRYKIFDIF